MVVTISRSICFGIFHIENPNCTERHQLRDELLRNIGDTWKNLNVQTISFSTLSEAEKKAKELNLHFDHINDDRKPGLTGFMKGEIGIWISTILAIKKFLESEFDILVLFEDDVTALEEGVRIAHQYLLNSPRGFDIFSLYTPEDQYPIYGRKRHFKAYLSKHLFDNPRQPTKLYQHWSAASYAISRSGARKILGSIENEITTPVDWHIFRGRFKSFSFKPKGPKPFVTVNVATTIQHDRPDNKFL